MSSGLEIYPDFPVPSPTNIKKKKIQFWLRRKPRRRVLSITQDLQIKPSQTEEIFLAVSNILLK